MTKNETQNQGVPTYSPDTKKRIIEVASTLFAKHGFDNASVRDISNEAGVNVASINYHFKNKLMLYKEVMNENMVKLEEKINNLATSSENFKEFSWNIFSEFTDHPDTFINSFKLFINNTLPDNSEMIPQACTNSNFGPPGFDSMLALLSKELPDNVPSEDREWAIRVLFGYIAHISLICSSTIGKMMCNSVDHLNPEHKRKSVEMHADAIINYLKNKAD